MRLRPRQYLLIALILLLGVYNFFRVRNARRAPASQGIRRAPAAPGPKLESPAWDAFDQAAALRDAPDPQFKPALSGLHAQAAKNTAPDPDLQGCSTWLEFYRQSFLHPSRDPAWHNRSTEHLDSCVKYHRDLSS